LQFAAQVCRGETGEISGGLNVTAGERGTDEEGGRKALRVCQLNQKVSLPAPTRQGETSLEEAIWKRRSRRHFRRGALSLARIGQLLWAAQGVTDAGGLRAAPSAGATYPLEVYLCCEEGVFHYIPEAHSLAKISALDARGKLARAALGQEFVEQADICIVIGAVFERTTARYGDRGVRYVHMDAGYASENVHLQAEALGLGSVSVGAFRDDEVARVLEFDTQLRPLNIIPVGATR
jgi:SagB-type dehydrogenase family enzyme